MNATPDTPDTPDAPPILMLRERIGAVGDANAFPVANAVPVADGELVLPFDLRCRSRLLTRLRTGEAVGIQLARGAALRGGDCLRADDGRVVRVVAADEAVMDARAGDALALVRIAYHVGNRHAAVQIGDGFLRFRHDEVLANMARGLGATVTSTQGPFEPEAGAYAGGGHAHGTDAHHAPVIHDHYAGRNA